MGVYLHAWLNSSRSREIFVRISCGSMAPILTNLLNILSPEVHGKGRTTQLIVRPNGCVCFRLPRKRNRHKIDVSVYGSSSVICFATPLACCV